MITSFLALIAMNNPDDQGNTLPRYLNSQKVIFVDKKVDRSKAQEILKWPIDDDRASVIEKAGYRVVLTEKYAFLVSLSVYPDKQKIKNQLALLDAIASGKAMDGQYISLSALDPAARDSLFQSLAVSKPYLATCADFSKSMMKAGVGGSFTLSKNGKSVRISFSNMASLFDDKKAVVDVDFDPTKMAEPFKPTSTLWKIHMESPSLEFVYGAALSELDRFDATADLMALMHKEWSESIKKLKDSLGYALSKVDPENGLLNLDKEGGYDKLRDDIKAEIHSKLIGMKAMYGFANDSEVDSFLLGANYSKTPSFLTLSFGIRNKQGGDVGIHTVSIPIGQVGS